MAKLEVLEGVASVQVHVRVVMIAAPHNQLRDFLPCKQLLQLTPERGGEGEWATSAQPNIDFAELIHVNRAVDQTQPITDQHDR